MGQDIGHREEKQQTPIGVQTPTGVQTLDVLLTVDDVAKMCNVSDKTIRRWIAARYLKCQFIGPAKRIRIRRQDLNFT